MYTLKFTLNFLSCMYSRVWCVQRNWKSNVVLLNLPAKDGINPNCYIAGIFPLIAHALIGQFRITWHLTMKLFPAKSLWVGNIAKSIMSEGNNAMLPVKCWPKTAVAREQNVIEGGVIIAFDQHVFQSSVLQWRLLHALLICRDKKLPPLWKRESFQKHTVSDKNCLVYIESLQWRDMS